MKTRKKLAILLTVCMVFSMLPTVVFADNLTVPKSVFTDTTGHWAQEQIEKWSAAGIIKGSENRFRPNDPITRAEMAVILNNLMGYQVEASARFADVGKGAWYEEALLKARAAGVLSGDGAGYALPSKNITREQAAVMLARAFAVDENTGKTTAFQDSSSISTWAKGLVFGMEADQYIGGKASGQFAPKAEITRAEVVTIIDNAVKAYYTKEGIYTENVAPIKNGANCVAIVRADGVTLKGNTLKGDLIVAEGVGKGNFTLDGATVTGKMIARGGGENSIHVINGADVKGRVSVERVGGRVRIVSDGVEIANLDASTEVVLEGDFANVNIAEGAAVEVKGQVANLAVEGKSEVKIAKEAKVETLIVEKQAEGAKVTVSGTVADVKTEAPKTQIVATETAKINKIEATSTATGTNLSLDKKSEVKSLNTDSAVTTSGEGQAQTTTGTGTVTNSQTGQKVEAGGTTGGTSGGTTGGNSGGNNGGSVISLASASLAGTANVNGKLTANPQYSGGTGTVSYQWYRSTTSAAVAVASDTAINGATLGTYILTNADQDNYVYCAVTATGSTAGGSKYTNRLEIGSPEKPNVQVSGLAFTDTDNSTGIIGGTLTWNPPAEVSNVTGYAVYLSDDGQTKKTNTIILGIVSNGNSLNLPSGTDYAPYLLVYCKNAAGIALTGTALAIQDSKVVPQSVSLTKGYSVSASHFKHGAEEILSIAAGTQQDVWTLKEHPGNGSTGADALTDASISIAGNAMTITGTIPGLSAENIDYLKVSAYEHWGGLAGGPPIFQDQVLIANVSAKNGSYSFTDDNSDDGADIKGYIDIKSGTLNINGDLVTLTILLDEIPAAVTFNKDNLSMNSMDFEWGVYIGTNTVTMAKEAKGSETLQMGALVSPLAADQSVAWSSSDNSIASVDQTGLVTPKKCGVVTIAAVSVADANVKATCTLTISALLESTTISGGVATLTVWGDTFAAGATNTSNWNLDADGTGLSIGSVVLNGAPGTATTATLQFLGTASKDGNLELTPNNAVFTSGQTWSALNYNVIGEVSTPGAISVLSVDNPAQVLSSAAISGTAITVNSKDSQDIDCSLSTLGTLTVKNGAQTLAINTDYSVSDKADGGIITLKKTYLDGLALGEHTIDLTVTSGAGMDINESQKVYIVSSSAIIYHDSPGLSVATYEWDSAAHNVGTPGGIVTSGSAVTTGEKDNILIGLPALTPGTIVENLQIIEKYYGVEESYDKTQDFIDSNYEMVWYPCGEVAIILTLTAGGIIPPAEELTINGTKASWDSVAGADYYDFQVQYSEGVGIALGSTDNTEIDWLDEITNNAVRNNLIVSPGAVTVEIQARNDAGDLNASVITTSAILTLTASGILYAPTITASGTNISWDVVSGAEKYLGIVNGISNIWYYFTTTGTAIDMNVVPWYGENQNATSCAISVLALAGGDTEYSKSELSNEVSLVKPVLDSVEALSVSGPYVSWNWPGATTPAGLNYNFAIYGMKSGAPDEIDTTAATGSNLLNQINWLAEIANVAALEGFKPDHTNYTFNIWASAPGYANSTTTTAAMTLTVSTGAILTPPAITLNTSDGIVVSWSSVEGAQWYVITVKHHGSQEPAGYMVYADKDTLSVDFTEVEWFKDYAYSGDYDIAIVAIGSETEYAQSDLSNTVTIIKP